MTTSDQPAGDASGSAEQRSRTGDDAERAWHDLLHAIKTWSETRDLDQHSGFRLETQYGLVYVSIGRSYDHANVDKDVAYPLVREQRLTDDASGSDNVQP